MTRALSVLAQAHCLLSVRRSERHVAGGGSAHQRVGIRYWRGEDQGDQRSIGRTRAAPATWMRRSASSAGQSRNGRRSCPRTSAASGSFRTSRTARHSLTGRRRSPSPENSLSLDVQGQDLHPLTDKPGRGKIPSERAVTSRRTPITVALRRIRFARTNARRPASIGCDDAARGLDGAAAAACMAAALARSALLAADRVRRRLGADQHVRTAHQSTARSHVASTDRGDFRSA